jgi:hypothetical protein
MVDDNSPPKKEVTGLSIDVGRSPRKEKRPGLSIDVGTPESRIGTPISSIGSDNDFGNSPIRTFSVPYTELLNKEISTSPTDLYLEIKRKGKVLNDEPHSRRFMVDGIQGGIISKMKAYIYDKGNYPKGNLLLKEYMYITSMSLKSPIVKLFEEKFFKEIYMQMIAKEIEEKCEVSIPSIIEFGKFKKYNKGDLDENYFYIIMDFIEGENPVNLEKCEELKTKVKAINECLKSKDIYHNDLNSGNVIINDGTITLIDFGEATQTEGHARDGDKLFNCPKKGGKKTRTKKKSGKKTRTKKNRTKRQKR